jgi:chorismate dehydratase
LLYWEGSFPEEAKDVNSLRISIVQYLNTAPLVRGFTHGPLRGKYQLSFTVPSQCAEALRTGAADVAIIPAIEYQRIPDLVVLPNLAIASKNSVRSLLIVSRRPIEQVTRIALDRSSRSTQTLVRILCPEHWRIAPELFEADPDLQAMLSSADAALLIGDPALQLAIACGPKAKRDAQGASIVPAELAGLRGTSSLWIYDVVEQWQTLTHAPAVLAVWAARKEVVAPELVQDFQDSLAFGLRHLDTIVAEAATELQLPASELRRYLTENIDYRLDQDHRDALILFYHLAARLGRIDSVRTVVFAAEAGALVTRSRAGN